MTHDQRLNYLPAEPALSAFQQFCADTGCPDNVHTLALWTQRNEAVAALKISEEVKRGYHDALIKASDERDKLKAEREQMEKQEPVAYVHKDDLVKLHGCNAMPMTFIPDSPNCWPVGEGESEPYEWLVALYAHPPVPDGKVLVDAYYSPLAMHKFQDAVTDLIAAKSNRGFAVSSDECRVLYEAMLKAAQQGE